MLGYLTIGLILAVVWLIYGKDWIHQSLVDIYEKGQEKEEAIGGAMLVVIITTALWPVVIGAYFVISMVAKGLDYAVKRHNKQNNT